MNARRSISGRARARSGRGRGAWTVLVIVAVYLMGGLADPAAAGIWTQLGSLPVQSTTAVCRTAHGSIVVATNPGAPDSSDAWEYDGLILAKLSARYAPRPIFGAIHALAEAPNGDLWVGAKNGAFRLTPAGFTQYTRNDGLGSRLVDQVNALVVASDGTVWAGTEGGGLSRFDGSTWTSYRNPDNGLPSNFVEGLALASDGTLWIAMHNPPSGPALASDKNGVITPSPTSPSDLSRIIAASDGRLWAVSPSNGAYVFDAKGTLLQQVQAPTISNDLTSVTEGPNGDIWIGSFSNGVYRWNGGAWENFSGTAGLTSPTARDVTTDAAGALWVATAGGLFRYEGALWLAFTPSAFPAMNGARIESISRGPASDFGASPPAIGVTRGPTYVGLGSLPPPLPGGIVRISGLTVEAVLDSAGQPLAAPYYVGAIPGGTWAGRKGGSTLLRVAGLAVTQTYPTPDGNNVTAILGRPDGTAWAGTTQNLLRFDGSVWSVVPLPGITPATIRSLTADANGGIWIGTDTKGAALLDGTGLHPVTGLPGGVVTSIAAAPDGDMWVGVQLGGVAHVAAGARAVDRVITAADGLPSPNNLVQSVGVDQSGRLWVGTATGLAYLESGGLVVYNTGDGLQTANVTAMIADTSEALLGSDSNGLALFHRDALAPRLALTDVPAGVLATRAARVDFAGGDLSSATAPTFSWSLDGGAATPFTSEGTARLSALADGTHTLTVWARDRALNQTPAPATLDFEVDATAPQPRLAKPAFGAVVRGVTPVVAIVDEPRFASWKLDVRPAGQEDPLLNPWTVLGTGTTPPPVDATLLDWDTRPYLDGIYELRFSVTDTLGLIGYAIVNVTIDNLAPGNGVTSPARVDNTNGGRVFTLNAEVEMYFPPRALDEDRIVTIDTLAAAPATLPAGASGLVSAWHVTPADFETKKPVTLTFDERFFPTGGAGSDLAVFAVNADGSYAYLGGSTDAAHGTLVTTTSKLGDFVVARGLFAGLAGSGRALDVQPRAFSPLGSTFDTRAAISFNLQSAEGTRVFVYDRAGRIVRRVYDGPLSAGRNVVYWDGRDGNGDPAPSGLYLVAVEVAGKADVRSVAVVNR
ncbi:MAG TPA: FlgD immunoglobulin-like domain containing protein [Candidatus Eisenbacteria bacterium]|nr:FlgD immunoglobulin-like domain containing protein [Candidatus Eisenbacteria bacterium]